MTPNVTGLPANFTMEADIVFKGHGARAWWRFHDKAGTEILNIVTDVNYKSFSLHIRNRGEELTGQQIPMDFANPVRQALWLQNGRMRFRAARWTSLATTRRFTRMAARSPTGGS
jgi:hypothetical protein